MTAVGTSERLEQRGHRPEPERLGIPSPIPPADGVEAAVAVAEDG